MSAPAVSDRGGAVFFGFRRKGTLRSQATAEGALLRKERRRLACETLGGGNFLRGRLTLRSLESRRPRLRNARRW